MTRLADETYFELDDPRRVPITLDNLRAGRIPWHPSVPGVWTRPGDAPPPLSIAEQLNAMLQVKS